jgi:1-aminocyclopropane-1-carboxylate deaminase/D-cysteine desulfhydrase-like pyridoxal-dependent ACC family enzyme
MTLSGAQIVRLLETVPRLKLWSGSTPVDELPRLRAAVGGGSRLLIKRDDAIPFGFGGNKIRKLQVVAAQAQAQAADTLITCGGVQSNHARATAAVAARLGMKCVLIANGTPQPAPTANALLNELLGAQVRFVSTREQRVAAMELAAAEERRLGRRPYVIPLGASMGLAAVAYAEAISELLTQIDAPDVIVHATSSGGTQAGLIAGCTLHELRTRVIGISADDPSETVAREVRRVLAELELVVNLVPGSLTRAAIDVDDRFVGLGYGIPSESSNEATRLCARTEALFLDPTYTAKAMAALVARVRSGEFDAGTVLFWHTGGQVGLFV